MSRVPHPTVWPLAATALVRTLNDKVNGSPASCRLCQGGWNSKSKLNQDLDAALFCREARDSRLESFIPTRWASSCAEDPSPSRRGERSRSRPRGHGAGQDAPRTGVGYQRSCLTSYQLPVWRQQAADPQSQFLVRARPRNIYATRPLGHALAKIGIVVDSYLKVIFFFIFTYGEAR